MVVKSLKTIFCCFTLTTFLLVGCASNKVKSPDPGKINSKTTFAYPSPDKKIAKLLHDYRKKGSLSTLQKDPEFYAKNIITWQMEHGGFGLHDAAFYQQPWDGKRKRSEWVSKGRELGNFDDYATVAEIRYLAEVYNLSEDARLKSSIKTSIARSLEFIFKSQYDNGGWPQVYPKRYKRVYSNNVTLNDDAMIRTMVLLSDILVDLAPFNNDLVDESFKQQIFPRLDAAVNYLLKTQIKNNNELTIWSAQYHPITNKPAPARSYELISKSSRESVGVLAYLMNWPQQTEEVKAAVTGGIAWYRSNQIDNIVLRKGEFIEQHGAELWYRFYEVDNDTPFFAGRDGIKKYDLASVEEERRKNYSWGRNYASKLLQAVPRYFEILK